MRGKKEMMSCHMKIEESNEVCMFKDYNKMNKRIKENEEMQKSNLTITMWKKEKVTSRDVYSHPFYDHSYLCIYFDPMNIFAVQSHT